MRHLPNLICIARIGLVGPIVAALMAGNYNLALLFFVAAAASDGADGYLAKRFGWTSEVGKFLDPVADKLLIMTLFIVMTRLGLVPLWLTGVAVLRDVLIGLGALAFHLWVGPLHGRPTVISKINTVVQLGYLLCVMARAASGIPPPEFLSALAVLTLITTLLSGVNYAIQFGRRAWMRSVKPY